MSLVGLYICAGCLNSWTAEEVKRDRQLEPHCPSCDDLCCLVTAKSEPSGIEREFAK